MVKYIKNIHAHDTLQYIIYNVYIDSFILSILHILQRLINSLINNTSVQIYTCVQNLLAKKKERRINRVILRQVQSIRGGRIYIDVHPIRV